MHAIIKMGDGKYYISSVFGYYNDVKSEGDYQRYLERIHTPYYVVFNEEKTKLIKWYNMQPDLAQSGINHNYLHRSSAA